MLIFVIILFDIIMLSLLLFLLLLFGSCEAISYMSDIRKCPWEPWAGI